MKALHIQDYEEYKQEKNYDTLCTLESEEEEKLWEKPDEFQQLDVIRTLVGAIIHYVLVLVNIRRGRNELWPLQMTFPSLVCKRYR